jgi:hypothetical protein
LSAVHKRFGHATPLVLLPQRLEQISQTIVVNFVHQANQATNFALGHTFSHKPAQVVAWQVGNQATFVFAKGHGARDKQLQVFGVHA